MDLPKLSGMSTDDFIIKLHNAIAGNSGLRNLGTKEKKILDDLIRKYKDQVHSYGHITESTLKDLSYKFYKEHGSMGISEKSAKDIMDILKALN